MSSSPASVPPFKRLEVHDVFCPEKVATFDRPHAADDFVVITIGGETLVCSAGTLRTVAMVLDGGRQ